MKITPPRLSAGSGELDLIEHIRQSSPRRRGAVVLGIGDDCAILRTPRGNEILVTTDFTLEGRHFRRDLHPAQSVGHRCLARGLSDLAAMGAKPLAAFLSIALPAQILATTKGRRWVDDFFRGLRALGDRYKVLLAGGDTAESPSGLILADITLVGAAPQTKPSAAAADAPETCSTAPANSAEQPPNSRPWSPAASSPVEDRPRHRNPQLYPEPRLAVGAALLRRRLATACLDLSDGLSTDLAHLCAESGVFAELDEAALPIHPPRRSPRP